jgi:type IV pilus assembly protein PilV
VQVVSRNHSRAMSPARARGFTLLEVMVSLFITAIGLLGIAKLQALAYASTGSANIRSLVAIQAAGLAASMHANRNYWANGSAPVSFTITGTVISDATLAGAATGTQDCWSGGAAAPCSAANLAAFDLHTWARALNGMLANSNPVTTISCPITTPINCTIQVTWNEQAVAINSQVQAATTSTTFAAPYTLYVEP